MNLGKAWEFAISEMLVGLEKMFSHGKKVILKSSGQSINFEYLTVHFFHRFFKNDTCELIGQLSRTEMKT